MIANNLLSSAHQFKTPNQGGPLVAPRVCIIHYTAGTTLASSTSWLCDPKAKASAHLIIGRDGAVNQLVAFSTVAWHAGQSVYEGKTGVNSFSVGIELCNLGGLLRSADGKFRSPTSGATVDTANVVEGHQDNCSYKYWEAYPAIQVATLIDVLRELVEAYPSIVDVAPHSFVAPTRKFDTGPALNLSSIHSAVFGRA